MVNSQFRVWKEFDEEFSEKLVSKNSLQILSWEWSSWAQTSFCLQNLILSINKARKCFFLLKASNSKTVVRISPLQIECVSSSFPFYIFRPFSLFKSFVLFHFLNLLFLFTFNSFAFFTFFLKSFVRFHFIHLCPFTLSKSFVSLGFLCHSSFFTFKIIHPFSLFKSFVLFHFFKISALFHPF